MIDTAESIRPETYASAKLAPLRNLRAPALFAALVKQPRLIELGWWIQSLSMQPAGLRQFATEFIRDFSDRVGTPTMHRIGKTGVPYTEAEARAVMEDVPGGHDRATWIQDETAAPLNGEDISPGYDDDFPPHHRDRAFSSRIPTLEYVARQSQPFFFALCQRAGRSELPWLLESFCTKTETDLSDPFWFHGLASALIDAMDAHTARAGQSLAMTLVTRKIFSALQFAWDDKVMVKIIGDSFSAILTSSTPRLGIRSPTIDLRNPTNMETNIIDLTPLQIVIELETPGAVTGPHKDRMIFAALLEKSLSLALQKNKISDHANVTAWENRAIVTIRISDEVPLPSSLLVIRQELQSVGLSSYSKIYLLDRQDDVFRLWHPAGGRDTLALARQSLAEWMARTHEAILKAKGGRP